MNTNNFDVVLSLKAADWYIALKNIPYIRRNLNPKKIIIVSSDALLKDFPDDEDLVFINEDKIYPGMTLGKIKEILISVGENGSKAGWYLQQFIKLSYSFLCKDEYYLVWDIDTIPLRPVKMFDNDSKPYFNMKPEYFSAYFVTLEHLLGLRKTERESFITEHMMLNAKICKSLINRIEDNKNIDGYSFFEKIIRACDFSVYDQVFSEFETYGTFVDNYYRSIYTKRHLETFRSGTMYFGNTPSDKLMKWASKSFDTMTFESWTIPSSKLIKLCNNCVVRFCFSLKSFVFMSFNLRLCVARIKYLLSGNKSELNRIEEWRKSLKMDYFFSKSPMYKGEIIENS